MISNTCKIEKGSDDLYKILNESERVAVYAELNKKQTLQLRLICEEMYGMLPNIIDDYSGDCWIEYKNGECKVHAQIDIPELTADEKENLIKVATNKKNAFAVGIVGKIRSIIENVFLDKEYLDFYDTTTLFHDSIDCYNVGIAPVYSWSLNNYRNVVKKENVEAWDELEKSIIANIADDVIVGVKGRKASIIIVKKFA